MDKLRLSAALLVLLSSIAGATGTPYTASVSGNWNDGGSYGNTSPGVAGTDYPAALTDVVSIAANKVLTIPANYNALASSVTLVPGANGTHTTLVMAGGSSLSVSSDILSGNSIGGYAEIDTSSGTTINMNGHNIIWSNAGFSYNFMEFQGNTSSHTVIHFAGGTFTSGSSGGFDFVDSSWTYLDIDSMTTNSLGYLGNAKTNWAMDHVTISTFAQLNVSGTYSTPPVNRYIQFCDFRNPTTTTPILLNVTGSGGGAYPSGRNDFTSNTISSSSAMQIQVNASSVTFVGNVFVNTSIRDAGAFGLNAGFYNNLLLSTVTPQGGNSYLSFAGSTTINNNFWYSEADNPHWFQQVINSTVMFTNNDLETNTVAGGTDDGDIVLAPNSTGGGSCTVSNNLHIGYKNSSVMLSMQGNAGNAIVINENNNTNYFDPVTSFTKDCNRVGETYAGRANYVNSIQNFLCVAKTPTTTGWIIRDNQVGIVQKVTTGNYNGNWNLPPNRYGLLGTYGVNDIAVNPNFVDPTRDLLSWDTSVGGNGTSADAMTNFLQLNGYGGTYNAAYNLTALMSYLKTGFSPQAKLLKGAGFDGSDIGAFPVVGMAPGTGPTFFK